MSVPAFSLEAYLDREADRVGRALERTLAPAGVLDDLPDALAAPIRHTLEAGGKRLRPVLCVAAYRACGGRDEGIHDLAISLELIHAYSLMHDDLPCMDDAALRRGRPTPHTVFGEARTLRAAAALIPAAVLQVWRAATEMGLAPGTVRALAETLTDAAGAGGMVGGQALDLLGEEEALEREALDELHGMKTGALLTAALRMGALAAGADDRVRGALEEYGRRIGLAFQIADDVLDATAETSALGKHPSDEALNKSTYVGLLGVEGARDEARAEIRAALAALDEAGVESAALEGLAEFVVARER